MRAYNKWLICQKVDEPIKLNNGMTLTQTDTDDLMYQRSRVVAPVGNLVDGIKEGDEIYHQKGRAFELSVDGKICTIVNENDIVAIV